MAGGGLGVTLSGGWGHSLREQAWRANEKFSLGLMLGDHWTDEQGAQEADGGWGWMYRTCQHRGAWSPMRGEILQGCKLGEEEAGLGPMRGTPVFVGPEEKGGKGQVPNQGPWNKYLRKTSC